MRLDAGAGRFTIETAVLTWTADSGIEYDIASLRPVVDERTGRLYGVTARGQVVLLKEYEDYRKRCARDAAITFWGDPVAWSRLPERVVSCVCVDCDQGRSDLASAWRITSTDGVIAARAMSISDHGIELAGDEHVVYASPFAVTGGGRDLEVDVFSAMIERFGEPYDMSSGEVRAPYRLLYCTS